MTQHSFCALKSLLPSEFKKFIGKRENPVKIRDGPAAVWEYETGEIQNQCGKIPCEGTGSRAIPKPEELQELQVPLRRDKRNDAKDIVF